MRLHFGTPREPLFVAFGYPHLRPRPTDQPTPPVRFEREVAWLYGLSWRVRGGFVFLGFQFWRRQENDA